MIVCAPACRYSTCSQKGRDRGALEVLAFGRKLWSGGGDVSIVTRLLGGRI